ncbi:MAG: glycosylase, partial [Bacteroidia bacterium]|nr:glycosylase [Bacteroidia bacterium]
MMKMVRFSLTGILVLVFLIKVQAQSVVPETIMHEIFEEVKTPFKNGLVLVPGEGKMVDCPSVFRMKNKWYMTYIVFDGKGYETWLAKSNDLLTWETLGKIMSFTENTWDANQKAGYIALQDFDWGGSYEVQKYNGKYWMSYLGGATSGYEAG